MLAGPASAHVDTRIAIILAVGRILVVDDEHSRREFLATFLKRACHEVSDAESGERALEVLGTESLETIIPDLRMPDSADGIKLLTTGNDRQLKTEVVVVTAFATAETGLPAHRQCDRDDRARYDLKGQRM